MCVYVWVSVLVREWQCGNYGSRAKCVDDVKNLVYEIIEGF